jgi:hypothetical protein
MPPEYALMHAVPFRLITVKGAGVRPGVDATKLRRLEETADLECWKRGDR